MSAKEQLDKIAAAGKRANDALDPKVDSVLQRLKDSPWTPAIVLAVLGGVGVWLFFT